MYTYVYIYMYNMYTYKYLVLLAQCSIHPFYIHISLKKKNFILPFHTEKPWEPPKRPKRSETMPGVWFLDSAPEPGPRTDPTNV